MNEITNLKNIFNKRNVLVACSLALTVQCSFADTVRHCNFDFSAKVHLLDYTQNEMDQKSIKISGSSAGKHGGAQVITARKRARDRIIDCIDDWIDTDSNKRSDQIGTCKNSNVNSSAKGFMEKTNGNSLHDQIKNLYPDICPSFSYTNASENNSESKEAKIYIFEVRDPKLTVNNPGIGNICDNRNTIKYSELYITDWELCQ